MKCVVIGGGIAGSFVSYYLLRDGHEVTLIDDAPPEGLRTSEFNSGILSSTGHFTKIFSNAAVTYSKREMERQSLWFAAARRGSGDYDSRVAALVPRSVKLYDEVLRGNERRINLKRRGIWFSDEEADKKRSSSGERFLSSRELSQMGYRWPGAAYLTNEMSAHTGKLLTVLASRLDVMGIRRVSGTAKLKCEKGTRGKSRILGAGLEPGKLITADAYVVAAGSWSERVCRPLDYNPEIIPARGLVQFYQTRGKAVVDYPAQFSDITVTQHDRNTLRITGFFELIGFVPRFSAAKSDWLRRTAVSRLSRRVTLRLERSGVGFRPCTPDQLPVAGAIPGCANGYIASGASRKGVTLAPLMGYLVSRAASRVTSETDIKHLEMLSPARFAR